MTPAQVEAYLNAVDDWLVRFHEGVSQVVDLPLLMDGPPRLGSFGASPSPTTRESSFPPGAY